MAFRTSNPGSIAAKSRIRKGDTVMVISGREKGKVGKVLHVNSRAGRVTVEKLNIIKRHTKPSQKVRQGGIVEKEAPMDVSNVMVYSHSLGKPSRVIIKTLDDGRRVRVLQKNPDDVLDKV